MSPRVGVEIALASLYPRLESREQTGFSRNGVWRTTLSRFPRPMPHPEAQVLKAGTAAAPQIHRISAEAMARGGLELERRWQLGARHHRPAGSLGPASAAGPAKSTGGER